jgi:DNA-directed RNA polymerase specialized sigma24 family protein
MLIPPTDSLDVMPFPRSTLSESPERASDIESELLGLFERFRVPLLRYVVSIGLSPHDGEEIIQEVFLSLFRHLQSGKSRHNLCGWIFRVAHNLALKQRTASQRWYKMTSVNLDIAFQQSDPTPPRIPKNRYRLGKNAPVCWLYLRLSRRKIGIVFACARRVFVIVR